MDQGQLRPVQGEFQIGNREARHAFTRRKDIPGVSKELLRPPAGDHAAHMPGTIPVTVDVDSRPTWVGIDPYNKRIDRNSDDNLTPVEAPK